MIFCLLLVSNLIYENAEKGRYYGKSKKITLRNWRVLLYIGKDENGKRLYKSFTAPTKKEAEAQSALYSIQQKGNKKQKMTVGQAIDKYIQSKENVLSPSTIDSYKRVRNNCLKAVMEIEILIYLNRYMIMMCNSLFLYFTEFLVSITFFFFNGTNQNLCTGISENFLQHCSYLIPFQAVKTTSNQWHSKFRS